MSSGRARERCQHFADQTAIPCLPRRWFLTHENTAGLASTLRWRSPWLRAILVGAVVLSGQAFPVVHRLVRVSGRCLVGDAPAAQEPRPLPHAERLATEQEHLLNDDLTDDTDRLAAVASRPALARIGG